MVVTQAHHGHLSLDSTIGVQKMHHAPTPRVGGIALAAGLAMGFIVAPATARPVLLPMLAAAIPAFAVGLWEDLTKRVSVRTRLAVTMSSGLLAWALTGISLTRVNVPGIDYALAAFVPLSVLFTAFAVSGAANAFNIIDGFNGLSGGVAVVCLSALASIAAQAGDAAMVQVCMLLAMATLGFLLVNFPFGKIFLGDGGAYLVGFLIGWVAVALPMRNAEVSVWATLLACAYPILETGFSIYRRSRRDRSPGDADRLHLHSLVLRRVTSKLLPRTSSLVRNSATGAIMWAAALVPALLAVQYPGNTAMLAGTFLLCALGYSAIYARLTQFRWCFRPATLATEASAA
ncbi:MraY family glycosyltransferase [Ramlibacter sp.]|uniref:MraY family glycosyltransferase n=1 Tax=Ramlibacter sp. TaxID=1917967 RepID=UPI003D0AA5B7